MKTSNKLLFGLFLLIVISIAAINLVLKMQYNSNRSKVNQTTSTVVVSASDSLRTLPENE